MAEDAFGIVGTVIASAYQVESVVAEGGFGTVYRAHHGGFRAPVALKCLRMPPGLIHEGQQHFLDSFRSEAELLFRLSASIPTVVRPLHVDAFTAADGRFVPYIVLEWLEGSTLDAVIRRRRAEGQAPLTLKKLVRLLTPVARALERAHNFHGPDGPVSIVHRDLKPENIFVAKVAGEEVVKILDFGIGKAKSMVSQVAGRASQGAAGIATFTPAYGSPEQWAPKRYGQTGPWTDVWGLALTLSECLVGHPIIDGDPAAIMGAILDVSRRPTPGSEGVIVSDEVEAVFARALAVDPRDRHADAGVFWNELLAAARISSGELAEVRLPRDARAEPGGGVRVERVEVARRPSARPPAQSPPPSPRPTLDAPASSVGAPALRSLAPSAVRPPFAAAASGSFEVPDLDLVPVSRPLPPPRSVSGLRAAVTPALDLDDVSVFGAGGGELALDLPPNDPLVRRASSGGMPAIRLGEAPGRVSSRPPLSAEPARRLASPVPGVSSSPAPAVAKKASVPPVSFASPAVPGSAPPISALLRPKPPRPRFRIRLAADMDATLFQRLLPGGALLGGAILVTISDQIYSAISGQVFSMGPLRTSVLAGVAMLAGIGLCVYRLKRD
jgi:serine/threonine protein kinase